MGYFRRLRAPLRVVTLSDSAFKAQGYQGLVMRGCAILLAEDHPAPTGGDASLTHWRARDPERITSGHLSSIGGDVSLAGGQVQEAADAGEVKSFPTDQRARQKVRKAQGHVAKKRPQVVEDHHDDCGEDFFSLGR